MKNPLSISPRLLASGVVLCALGLAQVAPAQPEAPTAETGKKAGQQAKQQKMPKTRGKNLTPRMVKAIEDQTGKPLTPELKTQLTTALRTRAAAIEAANDSYYAELAQATGLSIEQAREIDKPAAKAKTANVAMPATAATPGDKPADKDKKMDGAE